MANVIDITPMLRAEDDDIEEFTLTYFAIDTAHDAGFFNLVEIRKTLNVYGDECGTEKRRVARYRNFYLAQKAVKARNAML